MAGGVLLVSGFPSPSHTVARRNPARRKAVHHTPSRPRDPLYLVKLAIVRSPVASASVLPRRSTVVQPFPHRDFTQEPSYQVFQLASHPVTRPRSQR